MKHIIILLNIALCLGAQAQYGLYPGKTGYLEVDGHYEFFMTQQPSFSTSSDSSFADWSVICGHEVVFRKRMGTKDTLKMYLGSPVIVHCSATFYRHGHAYHGDIPPLCPHVENEGYCVDEILPDVPPDIPEPHAPVYIYPPGPVFIVEQGVLYLTGSGVLVLQDWPFGGYEFLAFSGNFEFPLPYEYNKIQILWDNFPVTDLGVVKK